ncbi:ABC transporter substrate-binding protein [Pseudochelatococcus lubricantis]|uniref:ABC transporter substrate-binding protein n=1 Tax=Pseudochelatococcus lubricantis TaxID=1538102 RepID=UPI0035E86C38
MKTIVGIVCAVLLGTSAAKAEIVIGAVLSLTGPAASLGIPAKSTIDLLPRQIGDETARYVVLDDASDPSAAVRAARKLVDEHKVDAIIGPSVTPTSLALLEVLGPSKTPGISLAGSGIIASPVEGNKHWSFKLAAGEDIQAGRVFDHLAKTGISSVAFIGFNDSFGDSFIGTFKKEAAARNVPVLADERYGRTDTSVTAQVLKIISANPGAVIIGASGTPGVMPVLELRKLGYGGAIYINQGMANSDVLRVGGAALEGAFLPTPPALVAEQLPDANPVKAVATEYVQAYEKVHGPNSRSLFGATAQDAFLLIRHGAEQALKSAKPGTAEFRTAVRDAMENARELIGTEAVFNLTPTDHNGTDRRASVIVRVDGGKWVYVPVDD